MAYTDTTGTTGTTEYRVMLRRGDDEIIPYSRQVHADLDSAVDELRDAERQPRGNLTALWIERQDGEPVDRRDL